MIIRKALAADYDQIWNIFSTVIRSGDTYTFHPNTPKAELQTLWLSDNMHTFVAIEENNMVGTYILKPNQAGLGDHIANCGYMVSPQVRGKGIGRMLCAHSMEVARQLGFLAMQFNIVVSTNTVAVKLWQDMGFTIIGTTPKGFRHARLGLVDTYIMYREL